MKRKSRLFLLMIFPLMIALNSCEKSDSSCGYHKGHELHKGPRGGCYYINDNGNKTYVGRSECNC